MLATARLRSSGLVRKTTPISLFSQRLPRGRPPISALSSDITQAAGQAVALHFRRRELLLGVSLTAAALWTSARHLGGTGK